MESLKDILKWLNEASEEQIEGLWECLIEGNLSYIEDCFKDKEIYKEFIKDIEENAINNATCYKCDCEINGEILCEDCLKEKL